MTPIGTIVFQGVLAIDRDMPNRPNSQISFSIAPGPFSDYFELPLTTKSDIAIARLIHYDTSFVSCNLTIVAQDHGLPPLNSSATIRVDVIDIDDKDPVFAQSFYQARAVRNRPVGSLVNITDATNQTIRAYDQDTGINARVKYSFNANPGK